MSIDTGSSLSYDKNYPVANIKQSSQKFRDNFSIIKTAIENLQVAATGNSSILSIQSAVLSTGQIQLTTSFINNSFKLPVNTTATGAGLIRYNSATSNLEYYNTGWRGVVSYNANGSVNLTDLYVSNKLTVATLPVANTDVVNLEYLNSRLSTVNSNVQTQINSLTNTVNQLDTDLDTEVQARISGDNNLQLQINDLSNAVSNATGGPDYQNAINNLSNELIAETNARVLGDAALNINITNVQNSVNILGDTVNNISSDLVTERSQRIANDAILQAQINSTVTNYSLLANAIAAEANTRQNVDNYMNATLIAINNRLGATESNVSLLTGRVDSQDLRINYIDNTYTRTFISPSEPVEDSSNGIRLSNGSIWLDTTIPNAVVFNAYNDVLGDFESVTFAGMDGSAYILRAGDTMTGGLVINGVGKTTYLNAGGIDLYSDDPVEGPFIDFKNASNEDWDWRIQTVGNSIAFISNTSGKGAFLDLDTLGSLANTRILTTVDGFFDMSNTIVRFPDSNVIVDADHFLLFQGIPNQVGGYDGAGIVFESTNLDYAFLNATLYAAVNNAITEEMSANGALTPSQARKRVSANAAHMANSYTSWAASNLGNIEFGLLRIFVTNDPENGVNNDSMALEPAASLYLNPGHSGGGQEQVNPVTRIAAKANARVIIGNAIENVVTIHAATGDIDTKGNIGVQGDAHFYGDFNLHGGSFNLPNSDMRIDANHSLIFEQLPANQANGFGDAGFITYDTNNFHYAPLHAPSFQAILANYSVVAAQANSVLSSQHEWSCLRIGSTNDARYYQNSVSMLLEDMTSVSDMVAIEPASDLYLNPGWSGNMANRFQDEYTRTNVAVYVGNSTSYVTKIEADTGNVWIKGTLTEASDMRIKSDLERISNALDKVSAITGYTYTRIDLPNEPRQLGVIAQDVELVAPELVITTPSGLKAVNYGQMNGLTIEAIKELKDIVLDLKAEVEDLKRRLG
jgi:hypothetical protein